MTRGIDPDLPVWISAAAIVVVVVVMMVVARRVRGTGCRLRVHGVCVVCLCVDVSTRALGVRQGKRGRGMNCENERRPTAN